MATTSTLDQGRIDKLTQLINQSFPSDVARNLLYQLSQAQSGADLDALDQIVYQQTGESSTGTPPPQQQAPSVDTSAQDAAQQIFNRIQTLPYAERQKYTDQLTALGASPSIPDLQRIGDSIGLRIADIGKQQASAQGMPTPGAAPTTGVQAQGAPDAPALYYQVSNQIQTLPFAERQK